MATILIIDDSPTELHLFQNMLEKSGFETLVADSGEDGIRQAEASRLPTRTRKPTKSGVCARAPSNTS
jgi:CheY-like chemotaxis protein